MGTGAITQYVDVAQLVLYLFWIFFAGIDLLPRAREPPRGLPDGNRGRPRRHHRLADPAPKTYKLANGHEVTVPNGWTRNAPAEGRAGAPLGRRARWSPPATPMLDGVGPGAWAERADVPDLTSDGEPKIVPLRVATDYGVSHKDTDPRGLPVLGADGEVGGIVVDLWIDLSEMIFRYLELEVGPADASACCCRSTLHA